MVSAELKTSFGQSVELITLRRRALNMPHLPSILALDEIESAKRSESQGNQ